MLYLNTFLTIQRKGWGVLRRLGFGEPAKLRFGEMTDNAAATFREISREQKSKMRVSSPIEMRMRQGKHHARHDTSYYPYSAIDRRLAELGL